MPWLMMTAEAAEAQDADMLQRCAAIRGRATRYSWPEETTEKGLVAVLVAPEHVTRLSESARDALLVAKPPVIEPAVIERPVLESSSKVGRP